jgi:hypothetical protein
MTWSTVPERSAARLNNRVSAPPAWDWRRSAGTGIVGVLVTVAVGVLVGVAVAVIVGVAVGVSVGVLVGVAVVVFVGVGVGVLVSVGDAVLVGVGVGVLLGAAVAVAVPVAVVVTVGVAGKVPVAVGAAVPVGGGVSVGGAVGITVAGMQLVVTWFRRRDEAPRSGAPLASPARADTSVNVTMSTSSQRKAEHAARVAWPTTIALLPKQQRHRFACRGGPVALVC